MSDDFYCEEVLSGKIVIEKVFETKNVLAYRHTQPFWSVHIVVIPKRHIDSLITIKDTDLLLELIGVVQQVAKDIVEECGACRVITNLGRYQESKHLHWHIGSGEQLK